LLTRLMPKMARNGASPTIARDGNAPFPCLRDAKWRVCPDKSKIVLFFGGNH